MPRWEVQFSHHQLTRKGKSMAILTLGIDLAKNVFARNGVNQAGKPELLRPGVARSKLGHWLTCGAFELAERVCRSAWLCEP